MIKSNWSAGRFFLWWQVIVCIGLCTLFRICFELVAPYYLKNGLTRPIDVNAFAGYARVHFIPDETDRAYIKVARESNYNIEGYFRYFLTLDLVFPLVYSVTMCTVVNLVNWKPDNKWRGWLIRLVVAGAIFDYLENFSFAAFLKSDAQRLTFLVVWCTAIKTVLFILNILVSIVLLFIVIIQMMLQKKHRM